MAASYGYLGQTEDGMWFIEEALAGRPEISLADERAGSVLKRPEDLEHYLKGLQLAGLL